MQLRHARSTRCGSAPTNCRERRLQDASRLTPGTWNGHVEPARDIWADRARLALRRGVFLAFPCLRPSRPREPRYQRSLNSAAPPGACWGSSRTPRSQRDLYAIERRDCLAGFPLFSGRPGSFDAWDERAMLICPISSWLIHSESQPDLLYSICTHEAQTAKHSSRMTRTLPGLRHFGRAGRLISSPL